MKKKFLLMGTDVRQQYLKEMLVNVNGHTLRAVWSFFCLLLYSFA